MDRPAHELFIAKLATPREKAVDSSLDEKVRISALSQSQSEFTLFGSVLYRFLLNLRYGLDAEFLPQVLKLH